MGQSMLTLRLRHTSQIKEYNTRDYMPIYTNTKWSSREEERTSSRGNKKHDDFHECPKAIVGTDSFDGCRIHQ